MKKAKYILCILCYSMLINILINFFIDENKLFNAVIISIIYRFKEYLFSCILIFLIINVINIFTKKLKTSVIIIFAFLVIISIINQLKIFITQEPLTIFDIYLLTMIGDIFNIFINSISLLNILLIIVYLVITIFILYFLTYFIKDVENINNLLIKIATGVVSLIILVVLLVPNYNISTFILNNIYSNSDRQSYNIHAFSNYAYYVQNGLIASIYGRYLESIEFEPQGYTESVANSYLSYNSKIENEDNEKWGQPNVIMILGESFWNIGKIEEVKFNTDITDGLNLLKNEGIYINLLSCTYGGLTSNVEYEVITGGNIKYYGAGAVPYLYKYYNSKANKYPSIIKELKNNGYYSVYISPTNTTFYNRKFVYSSMGVDKLIFEEDFVNPKFVGGNLSDESIIDRVIDEMNNKKDNEKVFLMALTEECHMPYNIEKYQNYDVKIEDSKLNPNDTDIVLSYAQSVYNLDKQIYKLYEYILQYEEPTILVFFGDHLPYLEDNNGNNVLNDLSIFNSDNQLQNNLNKYKTECIIVSNFEIESKNIELLGQDYLGAYIIGKLDINISEYFNYLYNQINDVPGSNKYITKYNNKLINTSDYELEQDKIRNIIQYKMFN